MPTGHFSQVVWKNSKVIGVGKATKKKDGVICEYVVTRYSPAGNIKGEFKDNIAKGSFDPMICSSSEKRFSALHYSKLQTRKLGTWILR